MKRITQEARFRQQMMQYLQHHSAEETARRYRLSRKTVYKWKKRWDGTAGSLEDRSRKPHHCPRQQTAAEIKLVRRLAKKYKKDLLLAYQKATEQGYTRSYGCFKRTAYRERPENEKKAKRTNKPYERAPYPGYKVQIDVKYVPSYCVADDKTYYQYTAKDECSRWTYREMYEEHSTFSSAEFLRHFIEKAPFQVREIQTDNGSEFTNSLSGSSKETLFEQKLKEYGIQYHRIRVATPRHNGKVERQHRTDEMRFYQHMRMFNLEDGRKQLAAYQAKSNGYIMTCLGMKSPNQIIELYLGIM